MKKSRALAFVAVSALAMLVSVPGQVCAQGPSEISDLPMQQIDYQCMNACTARGSQYAYCQVLCSADGNAPPPNSPPKQIDYGCISRCTSAGGQYAYCQQQCGF